MGGLPGWGINLPDSTLTIYNGENDLRYFVPIVWITMLPQGVLYFGRV